MSGRSIQRPTRSGGMNIGSDRQIYPQLTGGEHRVLEQGRWRKMRAIGPRWTVPDEEGDRARRTVWQVLEQ
jgi:hypothetical protein